MKIKNTRKMFNGGFTIVELLIVIVVIGILAAITIVAYNNVISRANETTLKADLRNASAQLGIKQTENGSFPSPNLPSDVKASSGNSFQYTSNGNTYCLSVTSSAPNTSAFHVTNSGNIQSGVCSGHGSGNESWAADWAPVGPNDYEDNWGSDFSRGNPTISMSSDHAFSGSQSMRIDYDVNVKYGLVSKRFSGLTIGEDYIVSAHVYMPSGQDSNVWGGLVFLGEGPGYDHSPSSILSTYFGGAADSYREPINAPQWSTWSSISIPFTADDTEVWVSIGQETINQPLGSNSRIYYDDVTLTPAP